MKYLLILLFLSCSTTQYLGGKKHKFNTRAQRVVWLQLAGWGSDLYPLIKFDGLDDKASLIESMDSHGQTWNYSAQNLRSSAAESFFYQMNAKAYIDKDCSDLEKLPLFQNFTQRGLLNLSQDLFTRINLAQVSLVLRKRQRIF